MGGLIHDPRRDLRAVVRQVVHLAGPGGGALDLGEDDQVAGLALHAVPGVGVPLLYPERVVAGKPV
jgi:hypothetical protein